MLLSNQDLQTNIQQEIKNYFEHIGLQRDHSISYYQIDTLSFIETNSCQVSLNATVGEVRGRFFQTEALIRHYYTQHFPNLRAILSQFTAETSIEDTLLNGEEIALNKDIQSDKDVMIIPVFAALNRFAIFAIDITRYFSQFEDSQTRQMQVGKILAYAQDCHLKICQLQNTISADRIRLTDRERQILFWVVRGKSNAVIAEIIGISLHTVNGYLRNIYLKTETCDRTSAAIKAVHHGLLNKSVAASIKDYTIASYGN